MGRYLAFKSTFPIPDKPCNDEVLHFYSFEVPTGLIRLLREYKLKPGESNLEARARLYKRLWCLLWVGCYYISNT